MKITVVCKTNEWQVAQLKKAAKDLSVDLEVRDVSQNNLDISDFGNIVLWRSSSLGAKPERQEVMKKIMDSSRILINRCLAIYPNATDKSFQQSHVKKCSSNISTIPTFLYETKESLAADIEGGIISFPFIQKPAKGSKGEGVELISNESDMATKVIETKGNVYQNFIKNSGDYRVFVLGGKVLGVIKRTAKDGGFLNNISKGGSASQITDPAILKELHHIGTTVASAMELTLCGVDVIYDENSKKYFFLEVNTVPQWKGFQAETGIDVAKEIISFCKELSVRLSEDLQALIFNSYNSNLHYLWDKKLHFLSRMFLWTKDPIYKEDLDVLREKYVGRNKEETKKIFNDLFIRPEKTNKRMKFKETRKKYFEKYPDLQRFSNLLFRSNFAYYLYGMDTKPYVKELVSNEEFLELKSKLENDSDALQALSTHAINYLYLLREYLGESACELSPERFYEVGQNYNKENHGENLISLQLYFYTHCIIGASAFYGREIPTHEIPVYHKMLSYIDELIRSNADKISMDNKFEFLVCAKLCKYTPQSEEIIMTEASKSLSPDGNFIIDILNSEANPGARNSFAGSEHRNVLYLMSRLQKS